MTGRSDGPDSVPARVDAAMRATPRRAFLPSAVRRLAEHDEPIPIGGGQTNSQPSTVRDMLCLLEVRDGDRVLDVGAGSGWTTAILAALTGPAGAVFGVERLPELAEAAARRLAGVDRPWARVQTARPGVLGAPEHGPYQRILVSAESDRVPPELVAQLADGGVMVLPVDRRLCVVRRSGAAVETEEVGWYRFVPLIR